MGRERRALARGELAAFAALTAILAASVVWHPADDGGFVLCAFRRLTNLPCAGCGLTRSFCSMAKGDLPRAVAFHPLGPLVFAATLVYWARGVAILAGFGERVARFDRAVRHWRLPLAGIVLLLTVWVARLVVLGLDG